jgi:spore maturation protein CgeB
VKLYIAGSDKVYAIENFYVKYLRESRIEVFHFPSQSIFYDYYQGGLINKLIFKAGLSSISAQIQNEFKKSIEQFSPDIIWVFKGMELEPESLLWAKKKGILLINYNGDNPFIFSGKGSGNENVTNSIPLYNLHLTYSRWVKIKMEADLKIPTSILPFGFNISDELYKKCTEEGEVIKACFLGNPDKYRAIFLQQIAESGIELDLYGNNWKKFVHHKNIRVFAPVYSDDLWKALRKYRVQLNLMRPHNPDTHNMRSFEVPGVGGIQLAPDTLDHTTYFDPGKEIFIFNDLQDCIFQIEKILSFSKAQAEEIRMAARIRSLQSGYTYKARANQFLKILEENNYLTLAG